MRDPDVPASPFAGTVSGARADNLRAALSEKAWQAFEAGDLLIAKARQRGLPLPVQDDRALSFELTDAVRKILWADPMSIYEAAAGMNDIYDTVARQGRNLANRFTEVRRDWTGPAADSFGDYHNSVLSWVVLDNHACLAQYVQDTATMLMQVADGVVDMRTSLANGACATAEKWLEAIKDALREIEADERDAVQEFLDGIFSDGVETGLQAVTEVAQDVLGALDAGVTALGAAYNVLSAKEHALGLAVANGYLASVHPVGTTAPSGYGPPDYADWRKWKTADR